jgi:hypothetical protein
MSKIFNLMLTAVIIAVIASSMFKIKVNRIPKEEQEKDKPWWWVKIKFEKDGN